MKKEQLNFENIELFLQFYVEQNIFIENRAPSIEEIKNRANQLARKTLTSSQLRKVITKNILKLIEDFNKNNK